VFHFQKQQKWGENFAQFEGFSPFPSAFQLFSGIGGAHISRLVLTRSEVRSCYTPRPTRGSACSGGVTLASFHFGEPVPPLATVSQVIIGRGKVPDPRQTAPSWWLSPVRTSKSNVVVKVW
jgi:hypothetical protein